MFSLSSDRLFKRYTSLHLCRSVSSFLIPLIFSLHFRRNCTSSVFFFKVRKSSSVISYFFALIIYSINLSKTAKKTFATGNAIYPLPRTIIQITNDNSIFRKEGIVRKKLGEESGHAQNILKVMTSLPVRASSGDVSSGDVISGQGRFR